MTDPTPTDADIAAPAAPGSRVFKRASLTPQDIFTRAATLGAQIEWSFHEPVDDKPAQYIGTAPFGRFYLYRVPNGALQAKFENTAEIEAPGQGRGSFNALIGLNDCDSVSLAKASVMRKLLDAMNQSRRDDPLLDEATPEEDLI